MMPFFLLVALVPACGDSLWSPDFKGYLSGSKGFTVGDTLLVQIDASSSLSFTASTNDSKSLTLEFSGGDSGNLFSFLPQVRTGGTMSTTGRDNLSLRTQLPVVVTAINADGSAQVRGSRTVAVQGKNESITVSGSVSPSQMDQKGAINFSRLANARLSYTTLLASSQDVLTNAELQTLLAPAAAAAPAGTTAPAAAGTAAPAVAATAAPTTPAAPQLTISDARKRQLLLQYLNRLIDVVFSQ
jgi:flagellar basal body L-ring protein FlgH